ncbi:hypothetical protein CIPAW_05G247400 [Carya illinoinensis]|uniref:TIR domain-containing protein n=1 Tax=Carya illinoinensis TaxID=32201 RepID=A0A8T1QNQ5_CARIL|nr:hypothetical protein CIPAW_05G247400 [Carya illinoinensis]
MASQGASSSTPPSSFISHQWIHDVFLSFRGADTRNNFTAHLSNALRQKGINSYIDDDLIGGEEISPGLLKAIEESRISIIIFSQNYASSTWCLEELIKILECKETKGQVVLPVFYKIDPSDVRQRRKSVGEALAKLEEKIKDDAKLQRWKTALTEAANLSGWHLTEKRNEPECIQEIIEWVNSTLVKKIPFEVAQYPIRIESPVKELKSLLDIDQRNGKNTCMVGIFGTGGIGKTTMAKAIYNSIASQFEGSCFLENIREVSSQRDGLIHLQNKLLSKILGGSSTTQMVDHVDQGVILIKHRLFFKRILLVLDDVEQSDQLEKLVGDGNWFGSGSKIIITTRDKHLLTKHQVVTYEAKALDDPEALQLFTWHAFNRDRPDHPDYAELAKDAARYAGGLPLALTVLGSTLKGKDIPYWKSKLDEYKRIPNKDIQRKLKISYDGLEENAQNIFLDIACFFKEDHVDYVRKILDSCGFHSYSGIEELKDKCLITQTEYGTLGMHDLLQEMGREIVRPESPKEPGERSRLWFHKDVCYVLEENTGKNKVEGILIDLPERDLIDLSSEAFMKMKRLRLFINRKARFSEEPNFLSNKLRVIDWPGYPGKSLPSNFRGKNLVVLRMRDSHLKRLKGVENFQNMAVMDLSNCKFLKKFPDVSRIPKLEKLVLDDCAGLVEIHSSVGYLDKLIYLSVTRCPNLTSFPKSLILRSLEYFSLDECSNLKNFPEIECGMENTLPSSIGYLVGLEILSLGGCINLVDLPSSIHQLQHLDVLALDDCTAIKELPSSIGFLVGLKRLFLGGCKNIMNLPGNIYQLQKLERLDLKGCSELVKFLKKMKDDRQPMHSFVSTELLKLQSSTNTSSSDYECFSALQPQMLNLSECSLSESSFFRTFEWSDIVTLPRCIKRFVGLENLKMTDCKQLREILGLPPNLREVSVWMSVSLAIFLEESDFTTQLECPISLESLILSSTAIVSLPAWFKRFVGLKYLDLSDCKQLQEIPELPPNIEDVYARGCTSLKRLQFSNVFDLTLRWIDLSDCLELHQNIGDDMQIRLLSEGHPKNHRFNCLFPGDKIPDWFSHRKQVSKSYTCEMDINIEPTHLDGEISRFAFSAVIGTEDEQDEGAFEIVFGVIVDGVTTYSHQDMTSSAHSNLVWFHFHVPESFELKGDLKVKFECKNVFGNPSNPFFKSCGFHLVHRYEEKAIDFMDGVHPPKRCRDESDDNGNLESNEYPEKKRHSSSLGH